MIDSWCGGSSLDRPGGHHLCPKVFRCSTRSNGRPIQEMNSRDGALMGLYAKHVFPRLCDWSMRNPRMADLRRAALSEVAGEILEIGFGTGLNLETVARKVCTLALSQESWSAG